MRKEVFTVIAASLLLVGCMSNTTEEQPENSAKEPVETSEKQPKPSAEIDREPSKEFVQSVEGQDEVIQMNLVKGQDSLYSMYVDQERYQFGEAGEKDVLTPTVPVPTGYPEVKMEILYIEDRNPDGVKQDFEKEYAFPLEEQAVTSPVDALSFHGTSGTEPDSEVVTIYLLDAFGGTLFIEERYFLEAQEGHGARFEQMLETLELNK